MTHPLTDEICDEITFWRNPYDNMRSAADWQLEQCIDWLESLDRTHYTHLARLMREAMRPQIVDLPQANSDVCGEEGMERARQRTFEENDELMRMLADS